MNDLEKGARIELSKRDFFCYCNTKAPKFYKRSRKFLVDFCEELQDFLYSDKEVLLINLPPRHGKSRTVGNFVEWVLGNDQSQKIMTGSYNETLSTQFAKNVRNTIMEKKGDKNKIVFSEIFPGVEIKKGDAAMNMWSLKDGYNNYLATSPTGTATGFGATIMIIDDLIKNAEEANNANTLKAHWEWFTNTMLSRLEDGGKIIVVMTRWHSLDLAGRIIKSYGKRAKVIKYSALQADGSMLCSEILSRASYENKKKLMSADIFEANYNQKPIDIKGSLYSSFKTYTELPKDKNGNILFDAVKNYTDTADEGKDYLCSINYLEYKKEAYILSVLYTQEGMEITEPKVAKMLFEDKVNIADIESNNGGKGFARSVEKILRESYKSNKCIINKFYQSKNKEARILSNATWVMQHIYFPVNWKDKWPEYYDSMVQFQRQGKNEHDDAQDCTTGIAEKTGVGNKFSFD